MRKPLEQFITQLVVLLALAPQTSSVQCDGSGFYNGPGAESPSIGRTQPGPADDLTSLNGFNRDRTPMGAVYVERHSSMTDDIKVIGLFTLLEGKSG